MRHLKPDIRRDRPLRSNGAFFRFGPEIEPVLGNITLTDQHTDTVPGLIAYACKFANGEEKAFRKQATEEEIEFMRGEIRGLLSAAVHGPTTKSDPDFAKQPEELLTAILIRTQSGNVEWVMSLDRGGGWRVHGIVRKPEGFVAVLMALLLESAHRKMISQCRNGSCGRFFLVESNTGGRTRSRYCSNDCMHQADVSSSAARQRISYKRRRATALFNQKYGRIADSGAVDKAVRAAIKAHPDATADQVADFANEGL